MLRPITAAETRPLRQRVLRPHQALAELVYPGDDAPDTVHLGAFADDTLVGIATLLHQHEPGEWRLRGMATAPEVRGRGQGVLLLEACLAHARAHGGTRFWCHARTPVVGFYQRHGLACEGSGFDVPGIGPHILMSRRLP
jgi:predicted GNAT family N-acyltransferase